MLTDRRIFMGQRCRQQALVLSLVCLATSRCSSSSVADERGEYTRMLAVPGDAKRGRNVFADDAKGAGCLRCHRVRKEGGEVGPDLSDVGGKFRRAYLIESVWNRRGRSSTAIGRRSSPPQTAGCSPASSRKRQRRPHPGRRRGPFARRPKAEIEDRKIADDSIMPEASPRGFRVNSSPT